MVRNNGSGGRFLVRGRYPDWAPDGMHLTYVGLSSEIYRVKVSDTTEVVRLTSFNRTDRNARDNRHPRYSPDGTKIAFASQSVGAYGNTRVMNADGSDRYQVTFEGTTDWLDWSPDGKEIVYVSYRADDWTYANGTIWIVKTGQKRQLTFNHPPS